MFPLAAVMAIAFVLSWTINFSELRETHRAAFILLWFITLLVFFFNLQTRCGTEEFEARWARILSTLCWIAAIPMVVVAALGLSQRIMEYGLTPDRVWAVFINFVLALFVAGYAAHYVSKSRVNLVAKTNAIVTCIIIIGIVLMASGLLDPRRISVNSQVRQLMTLAVDDDENNFKMQDIFLFLKTEGGIYGENVLTRLAAQTDALPASPEGKRARFAKLMLENGNAWQAASLFRQEAVISRFQSSLRAYPDGEPLPEKLREALVRDRLFEKWPESTTGEPMAIFWKVRFEENGTENYIFLSREQHHLNGMVWQNSGTMWERTDFLGNTHSPGKNGSALEALFSAVLTNTVQFVPLPPRHEIVAGDFHIQPPAKVGRSLCQ
jgi:hypothetical protein